MMFQPRNAFFGMIVSISHGLSLFIMNAWIAMSLYRRRRARKNEGLSSVEDTRDTEVTLFLYTLFLFTFTLLSFTGQVNFVRLAFCV